MVLNNFPCCLKSFLGDQTVTLVIGEIPWYFERYLSAFFVGSFLGALGVFHYAWGVSLVLVEFSWCLGSVLCGCEFSLVQVDIPFFFESFLGV